MTNRDAYVFGWVYGTLATVLEKNGKDEPYDQNWGKIPFTCQAQIFNIVLSSGLLTKEVEDKIGPALASITIKEAEMKDGAEMIQPLPIQGSWQLGYYAGKGGIPIEIATLEIAKQRKKKGLTQAQLAELVGVGQPKISDWERAPASIPAKYYDRLKEILM